jgi:hypothetical protein
MKGEKKAKEKWNSWEWDEESVDVGNKGKGNCNTHDR